MRPWAFISRAAAVGWIACLLVSAPAWAADDAVAKPAAAPANSTSTDGNANTNVGIPAEPAPSRSPLDSEPIRRRGADNGGTAAPSSHLQGMELSRVGIALAVVITLILLLRWGGRKLFQQGGMSRSTRAIQVLARAPLAPRQHIVVVRVGKRVIVVGDCGSQMNLLCEITDGDEVAALLGQLQDEKVKLPAKAFSSLFQKARGAIGGGGDEGDQEDDPAAVAGAGAAAEPEPEAAAPEPEPEPEREVEAPEPHGEPHDEPAISETRSEITGLMAKIRVLSSQFRDGAA